MSVLGLVPPIGEVTELFEVMSLRKEAEKPANNTVKVTDLINSEDLHKWAPKLKAAHVCDITVRQTNNVSLALLKECQELRELTIRVKEAAQECKFVEFQASWQHLHSLTIMNATLDAWCINSLSKLSLKKVSLAGSQLMSPAPIEVLKGCDLDLRGVTLRFMTKKNFQGKLFALSRQEPKVELLCDDPLLPDRSDYAGVLTKEKGPKGCYLFADLLKADWKAPLDELSPFLIEVGPDEDSYWQTVAGLALLHNTCALKAASPIKCPDGRQRIATEEPDEMFEPGAAYGFWKHVEQDDVTVIVMVKEQNYRTYFPENEGDQSTFTAKENWNTCVIKCVKKEVRKVDEFGNQRTYRQFSVGNKIVHHIQMDWPDGFGVEIDRLMPFFDDVCTLEAQNPGKSIFHCRSGYGRTGTFLCCMILEQLMKQHKGSLSELCVNLELLVRALRQQRSKMVAFGEQLVTVLEFCVVMLRRLGKTEDKGIC